MFKILIVLKSDLIYYTTLSTKGIHCLKRCYFPYRPNDWLRKDKLQKLCEFENNICRNSWRSTLRIWFDIIRDQYHGTKRASLFIEMNFYYLQPTFDMKKLKLEMRAVSDFGLKLFFTIPSQSATCATSLPPVRHETKSPYTFI